MSIRATSIKLVSAAADGTPGNGWSGGAVFSPDGYKVAFDSFASNLVPGDTNGVADVFVDDRVAGTTERASVDSSGAEADGFSGHPAISADVAVWQQMERRFLDRYDAHDFWNSRIGPTDRLRLANFRKSLELNWSRPEDRVVNVADIVVWSRFDGHEMKALAHLSGLKPERIMLDADPATASLIG